MLQNQLNGATSKKNNLDIDINGAAAEIIIARYYNIYPDLFTGPHRRGHDLILNGLKIDVKSTWYSPGYIMCGLHSEIQDADVYILVNSRFPVCIIKGAVRAADLIQDQNIKDMGFGNNYILEETQLRPLDEVIHPLWTRRTRAN